MEERFEGTIANREQSQRALQFRPDSGQMQMYLDTITAAEGRRQQITAVYLALAGGAMAALGAIPSFDPAVPAIAALLIALLWRQQIHYYQDLASAKWEVFLKLDEHAPVHPFADENVILTQKRKRRSISPRRLSDIENLPPMIIALGAALYLGYRLVIFIQGLGTE